METTVLCIALSYMLGYIVGEAIVKATVKRKIIENNNNIIKILNKQSK